jgi:adenylate cyclase
MARASGIVITLGVILLFLTDAFVAEVRLLDQLELKTYDMRLRSLPRSAPQHVTIAAIDEKSLARIGRWPWSRGTWAELVQRLDQAGARVIAFDIFFPERESARADTQFARSIGQTKKVVLGTLFLLSREEVRHLGASNIEAAMEALVPQAIADVRAPAGAEFNMTEPFGVIGNIPELQKSAAYTGHLNVFPDTDGVVRRMPLVLRHNGRYFPAFDVQAARMFAREGGLSLDLAAYGVAGINVASRDIPLDENGRLLVRYRGPEGTFDTVSISDILEQKADAALLRDRIVLIGNTAKGIGDVRVTPYGATFPGVEVRANIIESLLEGSVLHRPEWMTLIDIAGMLAVALIMLGLLPRLGVAGGALLAAVLLGAYLFAATALFRGEGLWLNVVYPSMLVLLLFASTTLVYYFFAHSEKRYLKLAFQHYVPPAVVDNLVAGAHKLRLGGEKRELTVLFSDIRGFTSLSEAMDPEELVKLMNEYFTAMTEKVFEHGGSLDKYIGDAIMAIYGAPVERPMHAALACRTALDMMDVLDKLQENWRARSLPAVGIGIGINTGQVIVGNMGSAERFNYTVVGDHVNLASRIESLNKSYGTSILVSEHTYEIVKDEFPFAREIDLVRVRGRQQPVRLYELMREEKFKAMTWLTEYYAAYKEMRDGERTRAHEMFTALHAHSNDAASGYHAKITKYPARRQAD